MHRLQPSQVYSAGWTCPSHASTFLRKPAKPFILGERRDEAILSKASFMHPHFRHLDSPIPSSSRAPALPTVSLAVACGLSVVTSRPLDGAEYEYPQRIVPRFRARSTTGLHGSHAPVSGEQPGSEPTTFVVDSCGPVELHRVAILYSRLTRAPAVLDMQIERLPKGRCRLFTKPRHWRLA